MNNTNTTNFRPVTLDELRSEYHRVVRARRLARRQYLRYKRAASALRKLL